MTRVSSNLFSWSNWTFENFKAINPFETSWINRVSIRDTTCTSPYTWTSLESSKDKLREKIQICKDKAGIRGNKYPSSIEVWKKEVVDLAEGAQATDTLPSSASSKNELVYNREIAKSLTNKELDVLSRNISIFASLSVIDRLFTGGKGIESGVLLELISKSEKGSKKKIVKMYLDHFSKKEKWGTIRGWGIRAVYSLSSWVVSGVIHTTFKNILEEMRLSTDGKIEPMFQKLLGHLEKFLKDYRGEKNLADFTENKDVPELCKELAPLLVNEFFPEIAFFKPAFGIPIFHIICVPLNYTIGAVVNLGIRHWIRGVLPDLLNGLSESALSNLTAPKSESITYPINYRFATALLRFINDKLFGFSAMLEEPAVDVIEPPPPAIAEKLQGVIDELMKLSTTPSNNPMIREGIRSGLIDGGYQLMKFWQAEQENLLQQLLVLAGLPFTESDEALDIKAEEIEFNNEWERQGELVETLSDRIFSIEVRKFVGGTPSSTVNHHLSKEHQKIKSYLVEGFSDIIGLSSCLKKAREDLENPEFQEYDQVLNRHLIFWEGFLSMIKSSTKSHYPRPATEDLLRQFWPLCREGVAQVDKISDLQDHWVLYTRHKALKMHFCELVALFDLKKIKHFSLEKVQNLLNKIETLLPPNALEVQVLKRFIESFSFLKHLESSVRDLSSFKDSLKKQGSLKKEGFELFKSILIKYPKLQEDRELFALYEKYSKALQEEKSDAAFRFSVMHDLSKKLEKEINSRNQEFKELELGLLHRFHPTKKSSDLVVPISTTQILKEAGIWISKKVSGYDVLEKRNLDVLQNGTKSLQDHVTLLQKKVRKMEANPLYFPVESILDWLEWGAGSLGDAWLLKSTKKNLIQDITGILQGISPLIMAKEEEGKRNLYSWIERLALYESVKYFRNKSNSV